MRALAPLLVLLLAAQAVAQPFECAPGCTERGNCNPDTGDCICPYGYVGKACEVDALSACRLAPGSPATCSERVTQNCECLRQCERFHCRNGVGCGRYIPGHGRGCFMREGVPPEQQTNKAPEEGEAGVKYYKGWKPGAEEAKTPQEIQEVMRWDKWLTIAPSKCPEACFRRGFCMRWWEAGEEARPWCLCHRGFEGGACETVDDKWCLLNCGGRGKCHDYFCHCKPPYFSLGCSRDHAVPHTAVRPSPVDFKIYMYELSTQFSYPLIRDLGEPRTEIGTALYAAYYKFQESFMHSSVRTYDPTEANMFYVPTFMYEWTGPPGDGNEYLNILFDHIRQRYPYWNRTNGRDHFFFHTADRGGCCMSELALQPVHLIHFGYYMPDPGKSPLTTVRLQSKGMGYSCYHPQRDVVVVPEEAQFKQWAQRNRNMTIEDILKQKTKLLFFMGGALDSSPGAIEFSGNSRQILDRLDLEWKDPDMELLWKARSKVPDEPGFSMEEAYRRNKFCFCPYGWGFGNRLGQAMMAHCIPVIVQEHTFQPYEDLLPYPAFSIRLTNADLPLIREILRNVTDQQYRGMLLELIKYRDAFHWYGEEGGRAFDWTVASLRRRWQNLKALYY